MIGLLFDALILMLKVWSRFDEIERAEALGLLARIREALRGERRGWLPKNRSRLRRLNEMLDSKGLGAI